MVANLVLDLKKLITSGSQRSIFHTDDDTVELNILILQWRIFFLTSAAICLQA